MISKNQRGQSSTNFPKVFTRDSMIWLDDKKLIQCMLTVAVTKS